MTRCVCCRQSWPDEFFPAYRFRGVEYRRARCLACRLHCKATGHWRDRLSSRNRTYRARLRSQVAAVRAARAA